MAGKFYRILALALALLSAAPLAAQTAEPPAPPPSPLPAAGTRSVLPAQVPAPQARPAARSSTQELEALRLEIDQIETQTQRANQTDTELQRLRERLDPIQSGIQAVLTREAPRLDEINARLEKIGPKPADNATPESAEVTRSRDEQDKLKKDVDDVLRVARLLQVRSDQAAASLSDRRRDLFKRAIMERSNSIASPWLWQSVMKAVPQAMDEFHALLRFRFRHGLKGFEKGSLAAALSLILAAMIGYMPARRVLVRFLRRGAGEDVAAMPSRGQKAVSAIVDITVLTLLPFAVSLALVAAIGILGFGADRLGEMFKSLIYMLPAVTFTHGLLTRIVAPDRPAWRIVPFADDTSDRLQKGIWTVILIVMTGKVFEAINQTISAALPFTVAVKGLVALLSGLAMLYTLRRIEVEIDEKEEHLDEFGPAVGSVGSGLIAVRLVTWMTGLLATLAPLAGYVVFGSFIVELALWVAAIGGMLWLLVVAVDEYIGKGLADGTPASARIRALTGLAPSAISQVGILSSGLMRLALYSLAALLILAPLGLDPNDIFGSMRSAFFGFQFGGVTIAPSTIIQSLLLFFVTLFVFRSIRTWVNDVYLPETSLDIGLRNSISTVIGYGGYMLAAVVAMSTLGLSFDKVAIVAGALSVGIGLGLQSIVNNFVSGLILLWERPIRVGDLIVVGGEQGRVRRINVRATEIETFDRTSLIVPNGEFISGRVQNKTHSDRMGRIIIPVGVTYGSDPEAVKATLLEVALANQEVASAPPPLVFFKDFGESSLDFELIAFVDIDSLGPVRSDLMFAIHKRFQEKGISFPFPHRTLEISGVDTLSRAIASHIPPAGAAKP